MLRVRYAEKPRAHRGRGIRCCAMVAELLEQRIALFNSLLRSSGSPAEAYVDAIESRWMTSAPDPSDAVRADELDDLVTPLVELRVAQEAAEDAVVRRKYLWSSNRRPLTRATFTGPSSESWQQKPRLGALFLTPDFTAPGFWEVFVARTSSAKSVEPRVWEVTLERGLRTLTLRSVAEWMLFANQFGVPDPDGILSVDWCAVASVYDAVAVLPQIPFAADGLYVSGRGAVVAPTSWSVPTTVLLRWGVESAVAREPHRAAPTPS